MIRELVPALALLILLGGCQAGPDSGDARPPEPGTGPTGDPPPASRARPSPEADPVRIVFLGDSLTAGPGLALEETFPALLEERLQRDGIPAEIVNAGVSGDTSAGGLRRLDWILRQEPDLLVLELGVNDGLRGQPISGIEQNLRKIVRRARKAESRVLLLGLRIPPSYGEEYSRSFRNLYPRIAEDLDVPLVPFLLEGVAGRPALNRPDGIHPNAAGHRILADTVEPQLRSMLSLADGS